jgi:diguanylate cyclase (GGDEF)-like protein
MLQLAGEMFVDIASHTDGAVAYYLRFDPEISSGNAGIFHSKINGGDEYVHLEPTDILLYDKDDVEHVGWFWIPREAGHPIWLEPYYNQNNNILMISFVIPLYYNDTFVGVVGMDFDYTVLTERIHEIAIFNHGFAHLELNGDVIHTGKEDASDHMHTNEMEKDYFQVSKELTNGMNLVLFASYDDIAQIRHGIENKITISVVLLIAVFLFVVFYVVKKIVNPLKKLTEASIKMANGDYNVDIEYSDTYEIQQLSLAFENMTMNLREHKKLQHLLAYRDALTGLRNAASYKEWSADFNKKIEDENDNLYFGVAVLDINDLKKTNDSYGHNVGDKLIKASAHLIADTFKRSPVFRIGGDEFVVILQGRDLEDYDSLVAAFEEECENTYVEAEEENIKFNVSIAKGFSEFNVAVDHQISDVFKRADTAMYIDKKNTKLSLV